jgi:hypothetical protein
VLSRYVNCEVAFQVAGEFEVHIGFTIAKRREFAELDANDRELLEEKYFDVVFGTAQSFNASRASALAI